MEYARDSNYIEESFMDQPRNSYCRPYDSGVFGETPNEADDLRSFSFQRIFTRCQCGSSGETEPLVYRLMSVADIDAQYDRLLQDRCTYCCSRAFRCYKRSVEYFRNSALIYVLLLVFSSVPISATVMGYMFPENCPQNRIVPVFGAMVGFLGVIFMIHWVYMICRSRRGYPCSDQLNVGFGLCGFVVFVMTIVDASFVLDMSPSFDPTSDNYCNEIFYTYAFYKVIATAVVIVLSLIIYIPGIRHRLCCQGCSVNYHPYGTL